MSILVKNGLMQLDEMMESAISKQQLFAALREKQIFNLGKAKRVYFEGCGLINIYKETDDKPGLPTLPSNELQFIKTQIKIDQSNIACLNCGNIESADKRSSSCTNCRAEEWMEAIY
jgi:uncharacterized membrane protein YcaP (DUF421 family)